MSGKYRVMVVDDDPNVLQLLSIRLKREGYEVMTAEDGKSALAGIPAFQPHTVITDLRMDGMDGMALFDVINEQNPLKPVIILTAHGTIPDAVDATKRGVFAYLTKPFESEDLLACVAKAVGASSHSEPRADGEEDRSWREHIITRSAAMEAVLEEARRVAASEASVLIYGQSGTGKELLAKAIHLASGRRDGPFVAINCGAIPESLLETELFGHSKGAFTGATSSHTGLFETANGGAILLDEIGDMPLALQTKLLRVLQEMEVRPVGSNKAVPIDVRVLSATHRNLEELIESGEFREDLYYRLNVVMLEIPPLAKRREDISLLANHFLQDARSRGHGDVTGFAGDAMEELVAAPWPGNVRQLRNVVEQCAVLCTTSLVPRGLVHKALRQKPRELLPFALARDNFERDYLAHILQMTEGNVAQAARLAERNRSEFYKLLRKHHLEPELFRERDD
ncbi:MAG: sigma 54-interacting transcriptional regulator [Gammaproteobacteria bacterium]|nr:sigma 54-interacting transcriptional regulator [Gammaproteobacteria bacterium]